MSNVRNFGATGDGVTDDTNAILHAVADGDGVLHFPRGMYLISQTIEIPLGKGGPMGISGNEGTATIAMAGAGPAIRLTGNHEGTGDPGSVKPGIWKDERMPTIRNLVVEGRHEDADGIELSGTMQALFEGVLVRRVRHGIRLVKRNRNVLISHCHVYHNTGVGIFLDDVNLHQINIAGSHISYNRMGGIRIERSEVRNIQITGNDIEYNNAQSHKGLPSEPTAEIYIDTTEAGASVNEVTIASNTIQATGSTGGANIRIKEDAQRKDRPPGLWAISGNVIGSQENNVHLSGCYGVALSGNTIYSCLKRNLLIENCRQISVTGCNFRRHTEQYGTGVRIVDSVECVLSGCLFRDESEKGQSSGGSLLEIVNSERITVGTSQLIDGVPFGVNVEKCGDVRISNCTIADTRETRMAAGTVKVRDSKDVVVSDCSLDVEADAG